MVDNFSIFGIIVRAAAAVILILVIVMQLRLFSTKSQLDNFKKLLLDTSAILLVSNIITIILNFFRQEDGNLLEDARHISIIFSSVSMLLVAIVLYLIYKYRIDGDE